MSCCIATTHLVVSYSITKMFTTTVYPINTLCSILKSSRPMCLRRLLCRWAQDVTHKVLPLWRYLLLPALGGYIHEDRLRSCGGSGQFSCHCVLEGEAAEQKQPSFTSTPRFSWETGPWCSALSVLPLPVATWREYLAHTGIRKSSCLWNLLQGSAQEFMQSCAFQPLG